MTDVDQSALAAVAPRRAVTRSTTGCVTALLVALTSPPARSQVVLNAMPASFTIEAYGNATAGVTREADTIRGPSPDAASFDGAARVLARIAILNGPDIGARGAVER